MKRKTKIVFGKGLAFSENKDMERLKQYSEKGWHFKKVKYCFYMLEKGVPTDYQYTVDYRMLNEEELHEYKAIAKDAGWDVVQSYAYFIFLRGSALATPIYSDKESFIEREKYLTNQLGKSVLSFLLIILILIAYRMVLASMIESELALFLIEISGYAFAGSTVVMFIGYLMKTMRLKQT